MVHCAIDVVYIYQNYQVSVNLLRLTVVDATRRKRISDNNKRWWQGKRCITASTTHKVSRQSAITSVENCVITLSSPSTMLPMNGCRMCVRSVDDRCAQYSDTALTAEIRTHGGWDGFTPATVACRNLQKIGTLSALYRCKKIFWLHTRDGPKFGRRRSSAEGFGRMFGSATWDYSVEVRPNFGQHSASLWLRINGVLRSPLALIKVNTLTISY